MISRYIQPAEPVYQVQPPRPVCGATRIDVGGHHVRLHLVDRRRLRGVCAWLTGLIMCEQLPRALALAQRGERHRRPDRGMRVLAAVLAHAGHVALDVAGIRRPTCRTADRAAGPGRGSRRTRRGRRAPSRCASARRRRRRKAPTSSARSNRSGIRRCRPSRAACRRRSRRGDTTRRPSRAARCCARSRAASAAQRSANARSPRARASAAKRMQHVIEEEAEPDAFALALRADQVHAVVPVAGAHQRQAVRAEAQARARWRARSARRGSPPRRSAPAGRSRIPRSGFTGRPSRKWTGSSSTPVSPVAQHVAAVASGSQR